MKNFIFILSLISLQFCSQVQKPKSMENTAKNNPYYSRTDKTKLNVSNTEWKKILPTDLYYVAREADTEKDLLQENTTILMNWENIIVPFVAIIYSEVRLNLLQLAVGQAF
jgi:hypothetical protein